MVYGINLNNKKRLGKNRTFYIIEDRFNMLNQLASLSGQSSSSFLNNLIYKTFNALHTWDELSDLNKQTIEIDQQMEELRKKQQEINLKLDNVVKIRNAQQEFKEKIEESQKKDKERYITILTEKIVCNDGPAYIMERSHEFSVFLGNKWTKEELIAEAMLKTKLLSSSEIRNIKIKRERENGC
jgi:hypothetical protein